MFGTRLPIMYGSRPYLSDSFDDVYDNRFTVRAIGRMLLSSALGTVYFTSSVIIAAEGQSWLG
jgi:hypothetical protein